LACDPFGKRFTAIPTALLVALLRDIRMRSTKPIAPTPTKPAAGTASTPSGAKWFERGKRQ
jgi:hypothetical protein